MFKYMFATTHIEVGFDGFLRVRARENIIQRPVQSVATSALLGCLQHDRATL